MQALQISILMRVGSEVFWGAEGEIMFSSREKDYLLQRKLLHGNFQGRGLEERKGYLFRGWEEEIYTVSGL